MHFHHGERFEVNGRAALFQTADHLEVVIKAQIRMQSTDNVKFGCAFTDTLFGALVDFFKRESVSAGHIGITAKSA
jgi:hypothetical protein